MFVCKYHGVKVLYQKYPYCFNLLIVLVLMTITRTLDSFAWFPDYADTTKTILLNYLFEFIAFLPLILLMIFAYHRASRSKQKWMLILLVLVFAVLGPTLILYLSNGLSWIFWRQGVGVITFDRIQKYTPGGMASVLFLSAAYYVTYLQKQYALQRDAMHKAETLAREVQLKMLHYQINPHFLFNVLNSIHALVDEDSAKAKKLVVEMSDYYRYTLNKLEQTITVSSEFEAVAKYLEIQKTRFEENFEYELIVDEAAKEIVIPSFVIHLLVENAVKYGIRTHDRKLEIRVNATVQNNRLIISVMNTGKLNPDDSGTNGTKSGIGNIKNRLSLFCNDHYSFSLTEDSGWVTARIDMEICNP